MNAIPAASLPHPPAASLPHLPVLVAEATRLRSPIPTYLIAGQIDYETACPVKTKCWNPRAQFNTAREQGVGLGQITRVYGRFDALAEMRRAHPGELSQWSWNTVYDVRYQLRALVLSHRMNYQALAPLFTDPMAPTMSAYNRGLGGIRADRRKCQLTPGCDASRWAGQVEHTCASGNAVIVGTRFTACQLSRRYWPAVQQRAGRYAGAL